MVSFEIPVLGSTYTMFFDYLKFHFNNDFLTFYCDLKNANIMTTLYMNRKNHDIIIEFLQRICPTSPIYIERINNYKYYISFERNYENIDYLISIFHTIFPDHPVLIEVILYNDTYLLGRCDFHLLDLYEMGYMTLLPIRKIAYPFYKKHPTKVFTGLVLIARNPFHKYHYDFIELDFYHNLKNDFLKFSFDMLLQDRPNMYRKLDTIIREMISALPIKKGEGIYKRIFRDWKHYHDMDIKSTDLSISLNEWKPGVFLKRLSLLLDMFPDYYINPKFNLHIQTTKTKTTTIVPSTIITATAKTTTLKIE